MTQLAMQRTRPCASFKRDAGQNNHFLITILVGLDGVQLGEVEKRPEFSTTWNPVDLVSSAARSRAYAINTSLVWISDLMDVYARAAQSLPGVCSQVDLEYIRGDGEDGKSRQLGRYARRIGIGETPELGMVQLAHHWRNKIVHSSASGLVDGEVRGSLRRAAAEIEAGYSGLIVNDLIANEAAGRSPTFKEIASIIHASHNLVQSLDRAALQRIDLEELAERSIAEYLAGDEESDWNIRTQSLWAGDPLRTTARLCRLLEAVGFHRASNGDSSTLTEQYLTTLTRLSLNTARERFPRSTS